MKRSTSAPEINQMDAREANVIVHSKMAARYNESEPHYRPENRAAVRQRLERLREETGGRLLDIGCGTGFIIDLAADLFDAVAGVDLTPAMLARVQLRPNVRLARGDATRLPFAGAAFDAVSAYSFFHHLDDLGAALAEAHRVLRPGGGLYVDLEPNRHFWRAIDSTREAITPASSQLVRDELASVLHTGERVEAEYGIPAQVFDLAEYNKAMTGGIDPEEFCRLARAAGFSSCEATYEWFAGQGKILHGVSAAAAAHVDGYLRQALPLSRGLYKYVRFRAVK
jgi:ubiquinone/menaquinone biosynthesis C-methylase UbiE